MSAYLYSMEHTLRSHVPGTKSLSWSPCLCSYSQSKLRFSGMLPTTHEWLDWVMQSVRRNLLKIYLLWMMNDFPRHVLCCPLSFHLAFVLANFRDVGVAGNIVGVLRLFSQNSWFHVRPTDERNINDVNAAHLSSVFCDLWFVNGRHAELAKISRILEVNGEWNRELATPWIAEGKLAVLRSSRFKLGLTPCLRRFCLEEMSTSLVFAVVVTNAMRLPRWNQQHLEVFVHLFHPANGFLEPGCSEKQASWFVEGAICCEFDVTG